jgi:regulator of replication initiation timing
MAILDEIKSVASIIQKIDNIELYQKILNLQGNIMEVLEENTKLKSEIVSLKNTLEIKKALRFERDAYWIEKPATEKTSPRIEDGPFCPCCWDTKKQLVRMLLSGNPNYSHCPSCKITVNINRE